MIGRVVSFGCSNTYGQGLSDCPDGKYGIGASPSKQAYPALLGEEFNITSINEGTPGCSNAYIAHKILNYQFLDGDFVIVQWTTPTRSTLFLKEGELPIGPWIKEDYCKQYYTIVDNKHLMIETMKNIHHIELYLRSKEIPFIFATGAIVDLTVGWKINTSIIPLKGFVIDQGVDNIHPGPESHKKIAKYLSHLLKKKYDTTN